LCATQDHSAFRWALTRCQFTRVRILSLDTRHKPGHKHCCVIFGTWKHSFLRLKHFTVLIPPNTTYCLLYSLYTLIKMSYFLKHYTAGKIFRCFSYDFSFYIKSVSTIMSVILSKQQIIIITRLYLLSVSVSMKRKHTPYPLFSVKQ
jgi:hypothetical protein